MTNGTWYSVGQGALGLLWSYYLQPLAKVTLLPRTFDGEHYAFEFIDNAGLSHPLTLPCQQPPRQPIEQLLVCCKAYQIESVLQQYRPFLAEQATVVISHNGHGTLQLAQRLLPTQALLFLSCTHGALKTSTTELKHTGLGLSQLAAINPLGQQRLTTVQQQFNLALPPVTTELDIERLLWRKLIINCAINPLTASLQCQNGELANPQYANTIADIIDECLLVANAEGIGFDKQEIYDAVYQVIDKTAKNYSSMNRDVYFGRRTEIDFISGYVATRGTAWQITTPVNHQLWQRIAALYHR